MGALKLRASEVGTVLGMNPRKSRLALYMEMRGEMAPEDLSQNVAVRHGRMFEDVIARIAADDYGLKIVDGPAEIADDVFSGHPDRHVEIGGQRVVLEVKDTFAGQGEGDGEWGYSGSDKVPTPYWIQTQVYTAIEGNPFGLLAARLRGGVRLFRVESRPDVVEKAREETERFLRMVRDGNPPDPLTEEEMRIRWLPVRDKTFTAGPETIQHVLAHKRLGEQIRALEAERSDLATLILGAAKDAGLVVAPHPKTGANVPIMSLNSNRQFSEALFRERYPSLAEQHVKLDTTKIREVAQSAYESCMVEPSTPGNQTRVMRALKDLKAWEVQP